MLVIRAMPKNRYKRAKADPASWISWYLNYYIFKEPNRDAKRELYREYLALMYEYVLQRDRSGLLAKVKEPELGKPMSVRRNGRLISQDIVNSLRERNSIMSAVQLGSHAPFDLAELGAGYGRLGYLMLKTTACRYFVFDIPPALYFSQWYLTTLFPEHHAFFFRRFERFDEIESELSRAPRFLYAESIGQLSVRLFRRLRNHQLHSRDEARSDQPLHDTDGANDKNGALPEAAEGLRESR